MPERYNLFLPGNHLYMYGALFILLFLIPFSLYAGTNKIDFEDRPVGKHIEKEYKLKYGVYFNSAKICEPNPWKKSDKKALIHATQENEFSPGPLIIYFDCDQSHVRLIAGLNSLTLKVSLNIEMTAYDVNGKVLKTLKTSMTQKDLATGKVLEIKLNEKKIRKVHLLYQYAHFEVIDDLEFDNKVTPPVDTTPPVVKIIQPKDKQNFHTTLFELIGTITEKNFMSARVTIKPKNNSSFSFELFGYNIDTTTTPITFYIPALGNLEEGENTITVTAMDIWSNKGSNKVTVYYFPKTGGQKSLGVYSLSSYEYDWKKPVTLPHSEDPYYDFWKFMVNGSGAYSVNKKESQRFRDHEVTIKTIIPIPKDNLKCWDDFDMVFFYGHNNTIGFPNSGWDFHCYYLDKQGNWEEKKSCSCWGCGGTSFDYYATGSINNAVQYPGALTYLYNKYTASLLGDPYDYGGGEPEGAPQWYKVKSSDTKKQITYGKLGSINLKWLILDGCQAVMTADPSGNYKPYAYKALSEVHGGYHIILGHYESYYTILHKALTPFAFDLVCGVPIQTAYFDTDPDTNSSAIAAEDTPFTWASSTMVNDTWLYAVNVPAQTNIFSMRWIKSENVVKQKIEK